MKIIFSILFIFLFVSCDSFIFLGVPGQGAHIVSSKCGTIAIGGGAINKS